MTDVPTLTRTQRLRRNEDVAWDTFDTNVYFHHNYKRLRRDDRYIIGIVGKFFARHFATTGTRAKRAVDVGTGGNLYPALSMLPWCEHLVLTDFADTNIQWLEQQITSPEPSWSQFWEEFQKIDGYPSGDTYSPFRDLADPAKVTVEACSVFDLPSDSFDLGTMFFVAESMTNYPEEFRDATGRFLGSLHRGAPFAAAFMDSSLGYEVGSKSYPAVQAVTPERVRSTLNLLQADAHVEKVPVPADDPLREGYEGMIIAVGTVRG